MTASLSFSIEIAAPASAGVTVEMTFPGGSPVAGALVFDPAIGVDMGDYAAPSGAFVQGCIRVRHPSLPNFFVDVRRDKTSDRDEVVFQNGECAGSVPDAYARDLPAYTARIKKNGAVIHTENVPPHGWGSRWRWQSAPRPVIRTAAQVFDEGFLPRMTRTAARIDGYSGVIVPPVPTALTRPYTPFMAPDPNGYQKLGINMGIDVGGGYPYIGLITEWQADWLLRGTTSSLNAMMQHAEMCAGDWGLCHPDSVTGAPVDFKSDDAHYKMYTHQSKIGTPGWKQIKIGQRGGWDIHEGDSHVPSMFYVPWVLTEDPYFIEAQQYIVQWGTGWAVSQRFTPLPSVAPRTICSTLNQSRTIGWGLRNVAKAHRMSPENPPRWLLPRSYYAAVSKDYSAALLWTRTNPPQSTSYPWRTDVFRMVAWAVWLQSWEHAYFIQACALADLLGVPTGTAPSWFAQMEYYFDMFTQITSGTSGWNRQCPNVHDIDMRIYEPQMPAKDWPTLWTVTKGFLQGTYPEVPEPGAEMPGSRNVNDFASACACAKQRGIPAAAAALDWLNTFIDYNWPGRQLAFYCRTGFAGAA